MRGKPGQLEVFFGSISPEAVDDGLQHPEVLQLAALGMHGAYPNHCSRDLVRLLGPSFAELPQVSLIKLPVQGHRVNEPILIDMEVQFPHDVLAWYGRHPLLFREVFGSEEEVVTFWRDKDLQDPAFQNHPALVKPRYQDRCIPLKLHSDAAVMSKVETLHVVSWASFFGQGAILEWQLLFGAVVKSACCTLDGQNTMGELYKCLKWSLEACLEGQHPSHNYKGEAWAPGSNRAQLAGLPLHPQGYFLAVFQVLGDLDELCNTFGLSHFNSRSPCFWCACNVTDVPWSDFSPDAAWRRTLVQPRLALPPPSEHPLWSISGVTVLSVGWDILHGLDLGPCLHVAGNVLEDMLLMDELGGNADQRLKEVWRRVQQAYADLGIANRLPVLEISSFRHSGEYPKLRAKGNQARWFAVVLHKILQDMGPARDEYSRHRMQVLDSLVRFYAIVDVPNLFLPRESIAEAQRLIGTFLESYSWLAYAAMEGGLLRWQVTVKFHYLAHAASLLRWTNVKFTSTYPGEAFVGKVAKIAWTASLGKPAYSLGGLLMQKIQAGRAIRLRRKLA